MRDKRAWKSADTLMLVGPQSLSRSTVSAVARQLQMTSVRDLGRAAAAAHSLTSDPVDALLVALDQIAIAR